MPVDEIVASAVGDARAAAFLAGGVLVRLELGGRGAGGQSDGRAGDILLGRVVRFEPDLDAAFVDLGGGHSGFLGRSGVKAAPRSAGAGIGTWAGGGAGGRLGEGDAVVVQIAREAEPGKAVRLTAAIAVPGRTLFLLPGRPGLRISRRLGDGDALARLSGLAGKLADGANGWFVRNAAAAASGEAIFAEASALSDLWHEIAARAAAATAPARLYRAVDPVLAAIGDEAGPALRRIVADDPAIPVAVRRLFPDLATKCAFHAGPDPLFDTLAISAQIDAAIEPSVPLAGGGAIHFAETPALVAIDVDGGAARGGGAERTALAVNLAAVDALAREIPLRELAGHIVIDFVPLRRRPNRDAVIERLRQAFARDRQQTQVAGYTRLGKVEMMRRRTRPSLRQRLCVPCPACGGEGGVRAPL